MKKLFHQTFPQMHVLKKALIFPLLLLLMISVSCRSNDEETPPDNQALIGIWQPYKYNQKATLSTGPYDKTTDLTICQQKSRVIFDQNDAGTTKMYGEDNGTCTLQNEATFTYTYDASSKTLNIKNSDGTTQSGTIKQLSESDLVYELVGTLEIEGEPNVKVTTTIYGRRTKD